MAMEVQAFGAIIIWTFLVSLFIYSLHTQAVNYYHIHSWHFRNIYILSLSLRVAIPSADSSVAQYYVLPVGGSVKIECGIRQGRLTSQYEAEWLYDNSINVESSYGDRAEVRREELRDLSLSLSPLMLTDSGGYLCEVNVGPADDQTRVKSPEIDLLVYRELLCHV